jgi:uncharacterized damage-inducible protein DinB
LKPVFVPSFSCASLLQSFHARANENGRLAKDFLELKSEKKITEVKQSLNQGMNHGLLVAEKMRVTLKAFLI